MPGITDRLDKLEAALLPQAKPKKYLVMPDATPLERYKMMLDNPGVIVCSSLDEIQESPPLAKPIEQLTPAEAYAYMKGVQPVS